MHDAASDKMGSKPTSDASQHFVIFRDMMRCQRRVVDVGGRGGSEELSCKHQTWRPLRHSFVIGCKQNFSRFNPRGFGLRHFVSKRNLANYQFYSRFFGLISKLSFEGKLSFEMRLIFTLKLRFGGQTEYCVETHFQFKISYLVFHFYA